jgi:hypothetical protein
MPLTSCHGCSLGNLNMETANSQPPKQHHAELPAEHNRQWIYVQQRLVQVIQQDDTASTRTSRSPACRHRRMKQQRRTRSSSAALKRKLDLAFQLIEQQQPGQRRAAGAMPPANKVASSNVFKYRHPQLLLSPGNDNCCAPLIPSVGCADTYAGGCPVQRGVQQ